MHDAAIQRDLVGLLGLHENLLGGVALGGWEDLVGFGGGDGEGAGYGGELGFFDEPGRVLVCLWQVGRAWDRGDAYEG